ncbi:MAG TPA: response regulator [Flavisolibacter sp.]|nr:response regulator [Flavisolibacter sp.]
MHALKTAVQKILLIDADEDDHFIFEHILCEVAPSVQLDIRVSEEEIVDVVHQLQPDLIFLDINLPLGGGVACLKKLQQCVDSHLFPVIIYSSLYHPKDIEIAFELGAVQFIQKGDNYSQIREMLQGFIEMPKRA